MSFRMLRLEMFTRSEQEQNQIRFGLMTMQLSDRLLAHMESWRRYAAMSKMALNFMDCDDLKENVSQRQELAWQEAVLCRLEMYRREELER